MNRPEQTLQRACVKWFRMQYPTGLIHHSPNGMRSSKVQGAIFKSIGVMAGFPDLICIYRGRIVFVELKADKGKLTDKQEDMSYYLEMNGFQVKVCRSIDDFMKFINTQFAI